MAHSELPEDKHVESDRSEDEFDTLSPVVREWLESLDLFEDKALPTIRQYSQGIRRVMYLAEVEPKSFGPLSLNQAELTDLIREMRRKKSPKGGFSKATLSQTLAALKSFYAFCKDQQLVSEVPDIGRIRKLSRVDDFEQEDPEFYTQPEIQRLFAEAVSADGKQPRVRWASRDLAMCGFLAVLGLRSAELLEAEVSWIRDERGYSITGGRAVPEADYMFDVVGKKGRIRRLPLSEELFLSNSRWQAERVERFGPTSSTDQLFVTNSGNPFTYQQLLYWLRLLNDHAGLRPRTPHALRHTAGVQLAAERVPLNVVQALLGHVSVATTGIYTEIAGDQLVGTLELSRSNVLLGELLQEPG
jgi:site-specific recombinase XerD